MYYWPLEDRCRPKGRKERVDWDVYTDLGKRVSSTKIYSVIKTRNYSPLELYTVQSQVRRVYSHYRAREGHGSPQDEGRPTHMSLSCKKL